VSEPSVSVVVPAYNAMPDVLEAVESALSQERPASEVVVVDDRSSDGTGDALRTRFGDRVRVITGKYGSASAARNAGWRAATGEWIAFLDADDLWMPDKLSASLALFTAAPHAIWCFTDGTVRDLEGREHASLLARWVDLDEPYCGSPVAELIDVNFILTSSVLVRRSALEALGGFDETLSHAEDVDLWIKLSRRGLATASGRPLVRYRARDTGLSAQVDNRNLGAATLFARLAADKSLAPALRQAARRRVSRHHYRLALAALRAGKPAESRGHLMKSWMFPGFTMPVVAGLATSFLPQAVFQMLRGRRSVGAVAGPMLAPRRPRLSGFVPPPAAGGGTR